METIMIYKSMKAIDAYLCRLFVGMVLLVMGFANECNAIAVTLGDQDFTDGYIIAGAAAFNVVSVGEPAPFDCVRGDDNGDPFSESWTFNYSPLNNITDATLILGIVDNDSASPGSQLNSFTVDSIDITSVLNDLFESHGGKQGECNVYTVNLPASTFSALSDGTATFALTLQGTNLQSGNGACLDFATLTVVPEPGTMLLLCTGGLAAMRRRRT